MTHTERLLSGTRRSTRNGEVGSEADIPDGRRWASDTGGAAMIAAAARRPAAGRAAQADPAGNPHEIRVVIYAPDPNAPAPPRVPSSRTIARLREQAEARARIAAVARHLRSQVQLGLRPPAGRLFDVDVAALLLRGPSGGIGTTERMARTLNPLAAGGRHLPAVLVEAGAWADEAMLREALSAVAPKLAVLGLRICRRKAGLRMAKVKPAKASP